MNDTNIARRCRILDLKVETLLQCELDLQQRVAEVEAERAAYREIAVAALDRLAALTKLIDRQHDRIIAILQEMRELRATPADRAA